MDNHYKTISGPVSLPVGCPSENIGNVGTYVGKQLAAMVAIKRSAGVAPEMNLRERISRTPPPSVNKSANSGFETQKGRQQKSKTGVSVAPQKGLMSSKNFSKK